MRQFLASLTTMIKMQEMPVVPLVLTHPPARKGRDHAALGLVQLGLAPASERRRLLPSQIFELPQMICLRRMEQHGKCRQPAD